MNLQPIGSPVRNEDSRNAARRAVRLMALVSLDGEQHSRMVITNVSPQGFRFESPVRFEAGESVRLTIGSYPPFAATILHSRGDLHGCRFAEPMSDLAFAKLIEGGPFATQAPVPTPLPVVERWPGLVRIAIIFGATSFGWAGILSVLR